MVCVSSPTWLLLLCVEVHNLRVVTAVPSPLPKRPSLLSTTTAARSTRNSGAFRRFAAPAGLLERVVIISLALLHVMLRTIHASYRVGVYLPCMGRRRTSALAYDVACLSFVDALQHLASSTNGSLRVLRSVSTNSDIPRTPGTAATGSASSNLPHAPPPIYQQRVHNYSACPLRREPSQLKTNHRDTASTGPSALPRSSALRVTMLTGWVDLASVKQLQLTSRSICGDCRESTAFHVRVVTRTPRRLWTSARGSGGSHHRNRRGAGLPSVPPVNTDRLTFGDQYDRPVDGVRWPAGLKQVTFGKLFNKPLDRVKWTSTLVELLFGCKFNAPVAGTTLPVGLRRIRFGCGFNQELEGVRWPSSLQEISFGAGFNKPIHGVIWPEGLKTLTLGWEFNQPVESVAWPEGVKEMVFSGRFDQPVEEAIFPAGLQRLEFGTMFNQPVSGVSWPASHKCLTFGCLYNHTLERTRLPTGLEVLALGCSWNQSIASVAFPASLTSLFFGHDFDQPLDNVKWPAGLLDLSLGGSFDKPLDGVEWPATLKTIAIGDGFDQPLEAVAWPPALEYLSLGASLSQSLEDTLWPTALTTLAFGSRMGVNEATRL